MRDSRARGEDDMREFIRPTVITRTEGSKIGGRRKCAKDLEFMLSEASSTSAPAREGFPSFTTVQKISSPVAAQRNVLPSSSANPLQNARSLTLPGYNPTRTDVLLTPPALINRPTLIGPPQLPITIAPTTSIKPAIVPPSPLTQLRFPTASVLPSVATLARRLSSPYTSALPSVLFQPLAPRKIVPCAPNTTRTRLEGAYGFPVYACPLCVNSFCRFEELKRHLLSMHPRRERILRLVEAKYGQRFPGGTITSTGLPSRITELERSHAVERADSVRANSQGQAGEAECVEVDILKFIGKEPKSMVAASPEKLEIPEHITLHIVSNEQYTPESSQDPPVASADLVGRTRTTVRPAAPKCRAAEIIQKSEVQLKRTQNVRPCFHNLPVPVPPVFRPWSVPVPSRPRCPHCPAKLRHKKHSCTHELRLP